METIKSIFEILNSNLGGLGVMALLGYGVYKLGQFSHVFRQMPTLVEDVRQLKVDVSELKLDVHQLKLDMALIKQKLGA